MAPLHNRYRQKTGVQMAAELTQLNAIHQRRQGQRTDIDALVPNSAQVPNGVKTRDAIAKKVGVSDNMPPQKCRLGAMALNAELRALSIVVVLAVSACSGPALDEPDNVGADTTTTILEAYYGLDALPPPANLLCGAVVAGQDGMPVTFSSQLNRGSIQPEDFSVETATGELVTPDCATLAPATEPLELRTVLLTGTFGTPDAQPRAVEVVGAIENIDGGEIRGLRTEAVTALEDGPSIVLAERFLATNQGIDGECPASAVQVVQVVWSGGVTGPSGAALDTAQRLGVSIKLEDGTLVTPVALADDDPDNFVYACLDQASLAVAVNVEAGLFHDPGDDANPATSAPIINRVP